MPTERKWPLQWPLAVALAALTFAVFAPALRNDFVHYDDGYYIFEHTRVHSGLTAENIQWAFTTGYFSNWHPLTWLSFLIDIELYGLEPWGHHLTSVLIHAINAGLLFLTLQRLTGQAIPSLAAAALFALHPLRVESVAWISERKDVLSGFFGFLCLYAYVSYVRNPSFLRYGLVALWLALGLMAKPMLVTWPCVLFLMDAWPLKRFTSLRDTQMLLRCTAEKIPLMLLAAASSVITLLVQRADAMSSLATLPLGQRLENVPVALVRYIGSSIWPLHLSFYYPHPRGTLPLLTVLLAVALLLVFTGSAIVLRRKAPYLLVGWLWFVGMLMPVIGILQVGGTALADRYTYLPAVGLSIAIAWGLLGIVQAYPRLRPAILAASVLVLIALSALTVRQIAVWRDTYSLFSHALALDPGNAFVHYLLGNRLAQDGRIEEGKESLKTSLLIEPGNHQALNDLGALLHGEGRFAEAEVLCRRSIEIKNDFAESKTNLGRLLVDTKRPAEGLTAFREAQALLKPDHKKYAELSDVIVRLDAYLKNNPQESTTP